MQARIELDSPPTVIAGRGRILYPVADDEDRREDHVRYGHMGVPLNEAVEGPREGRGKWSLGADVNASFYIYYHNPKDMGILQLLHG
jgi:hypothetical protein